MRSALIALFFIFNALVTLQAAEQEKLIFSLDLIRHGDRTADIIPKAPHQWLEGIGQLTAEGMQQEFQLGQKKRKRYIEDTHLLPATYTNKTIYVRSTDFERTLMSAQSFLMGLYPLGTGPVMQGSTNSALPQGYQPIPIHTRSLDLENELTTGGTDKAFNQLLEKYVFPTSEWKTATAELQNKFPLWSKMTGVTVKDLVDLYNLADRINVYQKHHLTLPTELSENESNQIVIQGQKAEALLFKSKKMGQITGKKLLTRIAHYLKQASEKKSSLKYVLLSGHDTTILRAMSAMEIPLETLPPYASDLNFSLFVTGSHHYRIKVMLNDQSLCIPACRSSSCSLSQFMSLIN